MCQWQMWGENMTLVLQVRGNASAGDPAGPLGSLKWQCHSSGSRVGRWSRYLQLLGQEGVLADGVDAQPLVRVLICQLPPLHIPQHPPVHIVAARLRHARWGENLSAKIKFMIPACCTYGLPNSSMNYSYKRVFIRLFLIASLQCTSCPRCLVRRSQQGAERRK